jgi:hypothetical protein
VQDLTHDARIGGKAYLVPSSMSGGNTVSDDPSLSGTAPGSVSIIPVADTVDHLPLPEFSDGGQVPVSHPGMRDKVEVQGASAGGGKWAETHGGPAGGRWKRTS